jgi:GWxTD domain-containing protein
MEANMRRNTSGPRLVIALAVILFPSAFSFSQTASPGPNAHKAQGRFLLVDGQANRFKSWLEQDVPWIITDHERSAFNLLKNDQERDQFVEAFWSRRDPTPDTFENEFKEEHYRRIVYANDHFGARLPGWKTDRGRIYIVYGPPDRTVPGPASQCGEQFKGVGGNAQFTSESWCYRYLEGIGMDVVIHFVDVCDCGDYPMAMPSDLRRALFHVPSVEDYEIPRGHANPELCIKASNTPRIRFKSLESKLNSKLSWHVLPFDVRTDVVKATDATSLVPLTIAFQKRNAPAEGNSSQPMTLNILGRVRTLTGHVAAEFEDTLQVDDAGPSELALQKTLALLNGFYRVEIAVQNANSDEWGTSVSTLKVGQ